ncbi:MAG TPA: helix-turn-helix transcriptional regulator [Longimicrobiaceae bacterium]|nr:helix-turn-helix transcriptional regulator [Longimicrobiaceae bacterium]
MVTFPVSGPQVPGTALLLAIDTLEVVFAFLDRGGQIQYASSAFQRCLEGEAFAGMSGEIRRFASALWGVVNVRRLGAGIERLESRTVHLPCGESGLQGTYVGMDLFGGGASVLVEVRMPPPDQRSSERLRERFGLTRKQSRVARLLMEGLRNDEIAQRLFISPHTARHHVEQIRLKVGGHTRAAVASRILQAGSEPAQGRP